MWTYIARRMLWVPVIIFAASLMTFSLGRFGPGDPVEVILGVRYEQRAADNIRAQLGLDRPFHVQYADYMWGVVRGDFGESYRHRDHSVSSLLFPKFLVSFQVNLAAMIVSLGLGLPLGFWVAHKQGQWMDPMTVGIALFLMSIPVMVTIPATLWVLCLKWGVVPCSGWGGLFDLRIIVPALTLGIPGIAGLARLMRASTLDVMGQDFIRTAKSKGLSSFTVDTRHLLKNAMIPIVTVLSFSLAGMFTTSFIVESILGIPGVGQFTIDAVFNRDYPIIMAMTILASAAFVFANLLADIAYAFIDPRIRYQ